MSTEETPDKPVELNKQSADVHISAHELFMHNSMSDAFHKQIQNELNVMHFGSEWARKSHQRATPKSDEFIAARDLYWAQLQRLIEIGESLDFIDNYEEGPQLTLDSEYETIFDETEEEWEARRALLPKTVTFPFVQRINDDL